MKKIFVTFLFVGLVLGSKVFAYEELKQGPIPSSYLFEDFKEFESPKTETKQPVQIFPNHLNNESCKAMNKRGLCFIIFPYIDNNYPSNQATIEDTKRPDRERRYNRLRKNQTRS